MDADERRKLEYIAGVVEDTAAGLKGDVILDEDDKLWAADYLLKAAAIVRKYANAE